MILKIQLFFLVLLWLLAGCGGSGSNGTASDPLSPPPDGGGTTTPPTGQGSVVNYTLGLSTVGSSGTATVGANSTVTATATLKNSNDQLIANQPVQFEEVKANPTDAPMVVEFVPPVAATSSQGVATTIFKTADTEVNRDVVIKATATIDGKTISAVSILKVVRSTGNYIKFITTKNVTDPDGNLNRLEGTVEGADPVASPVFSFPQLVTFQVLDKNAITRTDVPVTLEVFRIIGDCSVELGNGATTETVTTDNTGLGIFSAEITIATPAQGEESSCSIIFKARTKDIYSATARELFSYAGYLVNLKNEKL